MLQDGEIFEQLQQFNYIASITNVTIAKETKLKFHKTKLPRKLTTEDETTELFSKLNKTQLDKLYNLYKMDFEVFGYHVHPFVLDPTDK